MSSADTTTFPVLSLDDFIIDHDEFLSDEMSSYPYNYNGYRPPTYRPPTPPYYYGPPSLFRRIDTEHADEFPSAGYDSMPATPPTPA